MSFLLRLCLCISFIGIALYLYVEKQNTLTLLSVEVPLLKQKVRLSQEEIARLEFEIEKFQSPQHLMELARKPQYSHLRQPYVTEIVTLPLPPKESASHESHNAQ